MVTFFHPRKTNVADAIKTLITSLAEACIATTGYIFLFRIYEKRRIVELSATTFTSHATSAFFTGIALQALFIVVISITGTFFVVTVKPVSSLVSPLPLP